MSKIIKLIQSIHERQISNSFINKIYNMLYRKADFNDETIDVVNSNISGEITLNTPTYEEYVNYINDTFPNLIVHCDTYYILFADANVKKRMLRSWGDGVGIISSDVTSAYLYENFSKNQMIQYYGGDNDDTAPWKIESFNELSKFTSVVTLMSSVFNGQCYLKSVDLKNIKTLGSYNFLFCSGLTNLGDTTNITSISGEKNFLGCSKLTSINLPSVSGTLGKQTFYQCTALSSVNIPNVTVLDDENFYKCTALTSIDLPSVTSIKGSCFKDCTSLTTVTGSNLMYLKGSAFEGCTALSSIDFSNVIEFQGAVFSGCSNLGKNQDLDFNLDGKTVVSNVFKGTGYKTITLHETTKHNISNFLGSGQYDAFGALMTNLQKFDLSDTKQTGSTGALYSNAMTTLIYPETQTSLALKGKDYGTGLLYIICLSRQLSDISTSTYLEWAMMPAACAIYVWDDVFDTYLEMEGWQVQYNAGRVKKISQLPDNITWYTKEHPST